MAEAIQITLSHALGDACSPYVIGAVSIHYLGCIPPFFFTFENSQDVKISL